LNGGILVKKLSLFLYVGTKIVKCSKKWGGCSINVNVKNNIHFRAF